MKVLTLIEAVTDALRTEMAADTSVVVFGEDVGLEDTFRWHFVETPELLARQLERRKT